MYYVIRAYNPRESHLNCIEDKWYGGADRYDKYRFAIHGKKTLEQAEKLLANKNPRPGLSNSLYAELILSTSFCRFELQFTKETTNKMYRTLDFMDVSSNGIRIVYTGFTYEEPGTFIITFDSSLSILDVWKEIDNQLGSFMPMHILVTDSEYANIKDQIRLVNCDIHYMKGDVFDFIQGMQLTAEERKVRDDIIRLYEKDQEEMDKKGYASSEEPITISRASDMAIDAVARGKKAKDVYKSEYEGLVSMFG